MLENSFKINKYCCEIICENVYQYFSATVFIYANMWNVDGKKPESSQITESGKTWMRMGYLFRIFHFPANVRKLLHLFEKKYLR